MTQSKMVEDYKAAIRRRGAKPKADRQDPVNMQIAKLDDQLRKLNKRKTVSQKQDNIRL